MDERGSLTRATCPGTVEDRMTGLRGAQNLAAKQVINNCFEGMLLAMSVFGKYCDGCLLMYSLLT